MAEVIEPTLAAGRDVVTDRFTGSSLAYQGFGRGLPIEEVRALSTFAVAGFDRIGADQAVGVAELPDQVRGYEALKLRRAEAYRLELADRLGRLGV